MDLPAVVHDVPTAVVVSCGGEEDGRSGELKLDWTGSYEDICSLGEGTSLARFGSFYV